VRYPDHLKEDIRARVDIVDIVSRYLPLKKSGSNFKANCPFHKEKTPSFTVTPSKGIFHCFGCGKGGDVFSFLMEMESYGFAEAYQVLAKDAGIDLSRYQNASKSEANEDESIYQANQFALEYFHEALQSNKKAGSYLENRGINAESIKSFKFGFAPDQWDGLILAAGKKKISNRMLEKAGLVVLKEDTGRRYDRFRGRVMFPIYNISGLPVGFGGRTLKKEEKGAKYINTPETEIYKKGNVLYGLHFSRSAIREAKAALIVEGYTDFHSLVQAGFQNVVASSGTALTHNQSVTLRRYAERAFVVFDADTAGIKASERGVSVLSEVGMEVKIVVLPPGMDPDTLIQKQGQKAFQALLDKAQGLVPFMLSIIALKKHGEKTPEAKAKVVEDVGKSIIAISNEIVQNEYMKSLAEQLHLEPSMVKRILNKYRNKDRENLSQSTIARSKTGAYGIEKSILSMLIKNSKLVNTIDSVDNAAYWGHPKWHVFFDRIVSFIKSHDPVDFPSAMDQFEKNEQKFIAETLSDEVQEDEKEWNVMCARLKLRYCSKKLGEQKIG